MVLRVGQPRIRLGVYTNQDDDNNAMLKAHAYRANQDGYVTARMTGVQATDKICGYIGDTNDPVGAGDFIVGNHTYSAVSDPVSISFPVAKNKYFEITDESTQLTIIFWHPIGTLIKPTDFN